MTSQVIRVSTGEVIQIRTGVIQGIGPQGPIGPRGAIGETGPQGPQGTTGPTGGVEEYSTLVTASSQSIGTTTITSNELTTFSMVSFGSTDHDELSAVSSATNFVFNPGTSGADYMGMVWVRINKQASVNGSGQRSLKIDYGGTTLAQITVQAPTLTHCDLALQFGLRSTSGSTQMHVYAAHNEGVSLTMSGRMWLSRIGPGAQGIQGIQGIQGSVGDIGPQGPQGPAGSLVTSTTTFADIGGNDS